MAADLTHNARMPMFEELVLRVEGAESAELVTVDLSDLGMRERNHLQEWVLKHPRVLGDGVLIINSEYDAWQSAAGDPIRDRLDVLGLAPDGRLVVAELKRGMAPHSVYMQAITYASMVSRLTTRDVAELYAQAQSKKGNLVDVDAIVAEFETQYLLNDETVANPRIVLIAAAFPVSVTTSVVWLNERGVDISLIRYHAYRLAADQVMVTFSRLYPVPTVEEFVTHRYRGSEKASDDRSQESAWDEASLVRLAQRGNAVTLALLDLCASSDAQVTVLDIQSHANLSRGSVLGQLAGLTMLLRNTKNGFKQKRWPVHVSWQGGLASYTMTPELKELWTAVRDRALPPTELAGSLMAGGPSEDGQTPSDGYAALGPGVGEAVTVDPAAQ